MKICIIASGPHVDQAKKFKLPIISIQDIKAAKKKGEIKKLGLFQKLEILFLIDLIKQVECMASA